MAKRATTDTTAPGGTDQTTDLEPSTEQPHPDDARDADPQQTPTRGGSYVIENGVRRLVDRTEGME